MKKIAALVAFALALQPALLYADNAGFVQGQITASHGAPVLVQNPTNGQVLTFNGTQWVAASGGGGGATTSPWSVVLGNGATSGGTSPVISNGDTLLFGSDVKIARTAVGTLTLTNPSGVPNNDASLVASEFRVIDGAGATVGNLASYLGESAFELSSAGGFYWANTTPLGVTTDLFLHRTGTKILTLDDSASGAAKLRSARLAAANIGGDGLTKAEISSFAGDSGNGALSFDKDGKLYWSGTSDADGTTTLRMRQSSNGTLTVDDGAGSAIGVAIIGSLTVTAPIRGANGTAAAPTYSFTSDPDTGMFRSSNNGVGFSVDGTTRFEVLGSVVQCTNVTQFRLEAGETYQIHNDVGLSRIGAGIWAAGNGTAADATATLRLTNVQAPASTALNLGANATNQVQITTAGHFVVGSGDNAFLSVTTTAASNATAFEAISNDANSGNGLTCSIFGSYASTSVGDSRSTILLYDYTDGAGVAGIGPGVHFSADYGTSGGKDAAFIKSYKESTTDNAVQTSLVFGVNTGSTVRGVVAFDSNGAIRARSNGVLGWTSSTTDPVATAFDAILSRLAAGSLSVDTTTAGNGLGSLTLTQLLDKGKTINTSAGDSATIDAISGRFRKDTSGTTFTLTDNKITSNSIVMLTPIQTDATAVTWGVSAGSGTATITFNLAPTANFDMNFLVIN